MPNSNFDVELANLLAHLESYNKHLYRPNTYLHKWWARRCGSTFRLILKSLVEDVEQAGYYAPGGLEGKIVLDPMLGGGTTLHEAVRLGANVIGYDVDPIPVLQARATLSDISLEVLEQAFAELVGRLDGALSALFMTSCARCSREHPVRYLIYGVRQWCDCGEAVFVDSLVLRRERNGDETRLCDKCQQVVSGPDECACPDDGRRASLYAKRVKQCPSCGTRFQGDIDRPFYQRYRPLLTAARCEVHGMYFQAVTAADLALLARADAQRGQLVFPKATKVEPGPKSGDLIRRGVFDYQDLFSTRQLLYIGTAIELLQEFDPVVRRYLALLVSTSLEFNVLLCGYKGAGARRAGAIRHAFSHHAYSFPYTAVENNPLYPGPSSGTLRRLFNDRVRRARQWSRRPKERSLGGDGPRFVAIEGEQDFGIEVNEQASLEAGRRRVLIRQGSAAATGLADGSVDYVVTDPPYYDSVQYGDLSAFFRVWLRQMYGGGAAEDIHWNYLLSDSAVDSGRQAGVPGEADHYLGQMSAIFAECQRVLKPENGRLIFSFHHWRAAGWSAISIALKRAGFALLAHHVVHSENPVSVHIANLNALTDDAILVLASKGAAADRQWIRPVTIRTSDSGLFCRDCAEGLGWILATAMTEAEISAWWRQQLGPDARQ